MIDTCAITIYQTIDKLCKIENLAYNFQQIDLIRQAVCDLQGDSAKVRAAIYGTASVCIGEDIKLFTSVDSAFDSGLVTYVWTGPDSYNVSDQNPIRVSATSAMEGAYTVTITIPGFEPFTLMFYVKVNCCPTVTVNETGNLNPKPSIPCENSIYIDKVNFVTEIYTGGVWVPLPNALTDDLVCATASSPVFVNEQVADTIQLFAEGGTAYSWVGPDSFSSNLQNPTIPLATSVSEIAAKTGKYDVTVTRSDGSMAKRCVWVAVLYAPVPLGIIDIDS